MSRDVLILVIVLIFSRGQVCLPLPLLTVVTILAPSQIVTVVTGPLGARGVVCLNVQLWRSGKATACDYIWAGSLDQCPHVCL